MTATGSETASNQRKQHTKSRRIVDFRLETFALAITASGLTRNRPLPNICTIRSLFNQLMYHLIWIFFFKQIQPSHPKKAKTAKFDVKTTWGDDRTDRTGITVLTNEKVEGEYELINVVTWLSFKKSSN